MLGAPFFFGLMYTGLTRFAAEFTLQHLGL
jgi:hypothetical protein